MSSPDFRGIDTISSNYLYHTSDEDTPESWSAHLLPDNRPPEPPDDLPTRSPDEDTRGCCWPLFSGASATPHSNNLFAAKYKNIIFSEKLPLTQFHLEKYNLVIAAMAVNRAEQGSGFYKKKYKSWKEWYQSLAWKTMHGYGIERYGEAEAEGYFIYSPYGEIFQDGSFAVGITNRDIEKCGRNDNWTNLAGENWSGIYTGQMYFDKNGRPVAIVMTNDIAGFFGSGWSFIYNKGKWEYESKDDWDERRFAGRTESLDPYAPRFLIKNT